MPWTSAIAAAASTSTTPRNPDTSSPGTSLVLRARKRFEVGFASRTGAPGGIAAYDACSRRTPVSCCSQPTTPTTRLNLQRRALAPCGGRTGSGRQSLRARAVGRAPQHGYAAPGEVPARRDVLLGDLLPVAEDRHRL